MRAIAYVKEDIQGERDFLFKLAAKYEPVFTSLNNGLLVAYLIENGNRFEYLQNRHLREENISKEKIFEIGLRNLRNIALKNLRIKQCKNIYALFLDGNFEASLILIDELWEKTLKSYVDNKYIAAFPARDILVFCDSKSEKGIRELKAICNRVKNDGDHLLSSSLYIREDAGWVKYIEASQN